MKIATDGLIIKQQNIGERDKLVTVLTSDLGVIRAFVRNAKSIKSPNCAATELLCYSRLFVSQSKDAYRIDDASSTELFFGLRQELTRVSLAQYFCELAECVCPREQSATEYLRLFLNALYLLSKGTRPELLIKPCVEMRLLSLCGYMPDLVMCPNCGCFECERMFFLLSGGLRCASCFEKAPQRNAVEIDRGVLTALRHTVYADDKELFSFSLSEPSLQRLNVVTEGFLHTKLERDFQTLNFYKSLI